ncbi:hypothetical protein [Amaricoccus sp. W119]|uniref:hypothetical protein n=1 Tax=Amaricoccus sp. W119 TaxID=3391833 RepID=UPI0039A4F557
MPWDAIIKGGFPTLVFALFGYLIYTLITNAISALSKEFEATRTAEREAIAEDRRSTRSALDEVRTSNLQIAMEVRQNWLAFAQSVDIDLRARRFEVYKPLWQLTEKFPQYPRRNHVSYDTLLPFSESLRDWYFQTGGILLTDSARDAYFAVQKELKLYIDKDRTDELEPDNYHRIRAKCSFLRTELTRDLLSRRAAPVSDAVPAEGIQGTERSSIDPHEPSADQPSGSHGADHAARS